MASNSNSLLPALEQSKKTELKMIKSREIVEMAIPTKVCLYNFFFKNTLESKGVKIIPVPSNIQYINGASVYRLYK